MLHGSPVNGFQTGFGNRAARGGAGTTHRRALSPTREPSLSTRPTARRFSTGFDDFILRRASWERELAVLLRLRHAARVMGLPNEILRTRPPTHACKDEHFLGHSARETVSGATARGEHQDRAYYDAWGEDLAWRQSNRVFEKLLPSASLIL